MARGNSDGSPPDLQLPDEIRDALIGHLQELQAALQTRGFGGRMGYGVRPALIVVDLAKGWTDEGERLGSDLEGVVANTRLVLDAARQAAIPIFFTIVGYEPGDPIAPWNSKKPGVRASLPLGAPSTELDPRLGRRPNEKLIVKKYASSFKGTDLAEMLSALAVDTLIITGCQTLHCVRSTCADAASSLRVVVPEEAVGERSELFHLVGLLDIRMSLADVVPVTEVLAYLGDVSLKSAPKSQPPAAGIGR